MKNQRNKITSLSLALLGAITLQAQESPTSAGGEAIGLGGTFSYSIGQIITTTDSSTGGSISPGVQQAYEIFLITGINETSIHLKMSVYPNPTTDYLNLELDTKDLEHTTYQIHNLRGKRIASKKVTQSRTVIDLAVYPKSTYLFSVIKNNQIVKSYKIIKQ